MLPAAQSVRMFRRVLLLIFLAATAQAQTAAQLPAAPQVACINNAVGFGLMTQEQAFRLCEGSATAAPYDCYQAAGRALVPSDSALRLCRCALSNDRVSCYNQAHNTTNLNENQIIDLCTHDASYATGCNPRTPG